MTPAQLQPESFRGYQPQARALAESNLILLRTLPLSFLALLLKEVIAYDRKFPAERRELDHQFTYLASLPEPALKKELSPFREIGVSRDLEQRNWVDEPARFSEALSAHLWATHQIDSFHAAANAYIERANAATPSLPPNQPRLAVVIIGQGVRDSNRPLFRKLRSRGVYFTNVDPENGLSTITSWLTARSTENLDRYAHWAISGNAPLVSSQTGVTQVSYGALKEPRAAMSAVLRNSFEGGMGAEALRTRLAAMTPSDIGLNPAGDPAATWFQLSLLSQGSGTQIFSTSFVQWAAREALRRAEPLTLVCRYSPRQRASSMKDLLSSSGPNAAILDPEGSLVDADMAAYQTWLNLQRLPGASDSRFICWFEDHGQMIVIAPGLQPGVTDEKATTFEKIGRMMWAF